MFRKKKKKKVKWYNKYSDIDFDNMSDEEFERVYVKYRNTSLSHGLLGITLLILSILLIYLGGVYLW